MGDYDNQAIQQQIEAKYPKSFGAKASEDVRGFVQHFKIYAQIKGIHNDIAQVKTHLAQFLDAGPATRWWLNNEAVVFAGMTEYLDSLITHFDRPKPKFALLEELHSRKYEASDTIPSYTDSIQKLAFKLNMGEPETISAFILGLPTSIRGIVAALNPQTFSEAYTAVCKLKGALPTLPPTAAALHGINSTDENGATIQDRVNTILSKLNELEVDNNPLQPGESNSITCQLCGKPNHTALTCYLYTQYQTEDM